STTYAEELEFDSETFDVVYVRQAMHHAHDLGKFISEAFRVLKKGGILFTIRDHVVFDEEDKKIFLQTHPLHKFYGGENAYTSEEYKGAMKAAGFTVLQEIKYYDSVINFWPITEQHVKELPLIMEKKLKEELKRKL